MWNNKKINEHKKAAKALLKIKDSTFDYICENRTISEYDVQQFIKNKFVEFNLKSNRQSPIVAFTGNTSFVHYFANPRSKKFKPRTLIMLDIWARLNKKGAPFADITWMAYYGKKIPKEVLKIFNIVARARNKAVNFIRYNLKNNIITTGKEIDNVVRDVIKKAGYGKNFLHNTGHSLGFTRPHGRNGRIWPKNNKPLLKNVAYTIEPGIYIKNKFGVRSEIDFYITKNSKIVITTDVQKSIYKIKN